MVRNNLGCSVIFQIIARGIFGILIVQFEYAAGLHTLTWGHHAIPHAPACQAGTCLASAAPEEEDQGANCSERLSLWASGVGRRGTGCYCSFSEASLGLATSGTCSARFHCATVASSYDEQSMVVVRLLPSKNQGLGYLLSQLWRTLEECLRGSAGTAAARPSPKQGAEETAPVETQRAFTTWSRRDITRCSAATAASPALREGSWQGQRQGCCQPRGARCGRSVCGTHSYGDGDYRPKMQEMMQALSACKDSLPPNVRALISEQEESQTAYKAKEMHRQVAAQTTKLKKLASLRAQRAQYLQQWHKYVGTLAKTLQTQVAEKESAMQAFADSESTLVEEISEARAAVLQLAESQPSEGVMDMDDPGTDPWLETPLQKQTETQLVALMQRTVHEATQAAPKRDGSRTPRRIGKDAAADISGAADQATAAKDGADAAMKQVPPTANTGKPHSQDLS